MNSYFELLEKIVLSVLIVCTIIAIGMEIQGMIAVYKVTLADILLLFIYIEIIGMIKEYWVSKMIDRKSTRLNSSHSQQSRMPSSA